MTIIFRYKKVTRPDKTEVKSPSIPITLIGKTMRFDAVALLDSGADVSAVPKDIAELLGLDLSGKREPAYGIGGKVDSVESSLSIIIEKGHEHYSFDIPVKVILDSYEFPVLLGRAGFFDKFVVSFNQKAEKILLKKS